MTKKKFETKKMVLSAVFTAIVLVLQMLGSFVKFGPFSISLVLVPIVIGAAVCGTGRIYAFCGQSLHYAHFYGGGRFV